MFSVKAGVKAGAALGKWLRVEGAAANLKTLDLRINGRLGDEGAAAIADGLAAGGVALEQLSLGKTDAGPSAAPVLGKWLTVDGAAANLNRLDLDNHDLGDEGVAAIVNGLAAGGGALEKLYLERTKAGLKAAAALVKWLGVEDARRPA